MSNLVQQEEANKYPESLSSMVDNSHSHHLGDPMFRKFKTILGQEISYFFGSFLASSLPYPLFLQFSLEIIIKTNQTELKNTIDHNCMNPFGFDNDILICNSFSPQNPNLGLLLRNIKALNQFALIYLDLGIQKEGQAHQISQKVQIKLFSLRLKKQNGTGRFFRNKQIGKRFIELIDQDESTSFRFYGENIQHLIGFYRQLKQQNYLLTIKFSNPEQIAKARMNPILKAILINHEFSLFVIILRGVGFVMTLCTGALYLRRYVSVHQSQRIIEQKIVLVMSILILFFNDPIYFISVFWPSTFSSIISVFFLTQFIVFLFFFWIFGAERIYKEQGQLVSGITKRAKKIIYFLYFLCYFVMLSWYYSKIAIASYQGHFIVNPQEISPGLSFMFEIWLIMNITIYALIVVNIFQKGRAQMWRSRSWLYFNTYFALILVIFVLLSGSIYEESSKLILIFYVSLNLYCIYMQYMFSTSIIQKNKEKMIPISSNENEDFPLQSIQINLQNISSIQNNTLSSKL